MSTLSSVAKLSVLAFLGVGFISSCNSYLSRESPTDVETASAPAPATVKAPAGYAETNKTGVFFRWCQPSDSCPKPDYVIGQYSQIDVYCRDADCDLYAKVNVKNSAGQVIGWTNDTGSGGVGDHVILTLDTPEESAAKFSGLELSAR
jgi:hypothetical protein